MTKYKVVTQKVGQKLMFEHGMGNSSKAILGTFLGEKNGRDYPYDSGDFLRCLGVVISFDIDINIMKNSSYIWNRIILQWDELVALGLEGEDKKINLLLDEILDKPKTSLEHVEEADCIISINRAPEGHPTTIELRKNIFKPNKDA